MGGPIGSLGARLLVVVALGGRRLALPAGGVAEIVPEPRLVLPPRMPQVLAGLFMLRGRVVPVARADLLLDLPVQSTAPFRALVVLAAPEAWALLVDHADDVCEAPLAAPPADIAFNECVSALAAVGGEAIPVLAPDRLLQRREAEALAEFSRIASHRWREFAGAVG